MLYQAMCQLDMKNIICERILKLLMDYDFY